MKTKILVLGLLLNSFTGIHAAPPATPIPANSDPDRIYQFFIQSEASKDRTGLGFYLWIPPNTPKIRAVMVGINNALPINILQSPPVRAVCRKHGIAQILFTPWAKDIGGVMMKDDTFDVTDPKRTAVYDAYLNQLADVSGHPELVAAPIMPLGHSAFCGFPFEAAIRKPEQCLGAIPIKAGLPDVYKFFGPDGKAMLPSPDMALRNVPILFVTSGSQETVSWSAYPHAYGTYLSNYRSADSADNPGTEYQAHNELFSSCWEMMSGHFDMSPRNYQFAADWLDAIAAARLPEKAGDPLKNLTLRDGWLMNPKIPATGELPADYPMPAPYLEYKGPRAQALWFPTEKLARTQFELGFSEPRKEIEMFTFLDPAGQPIDLAHGSLATMPDPQLLLKEDGRFTITTHHFTAPFDVCTVKDKNHPKHPEQPHVMENVLFPGKTALLVSSIPLQFDPNGGPVEFEKREEFKDDRGITETRFTMRLKRHRLAPDSGFSMFFCRIYHEGDKRFAAAGRTCQVGWSVQDASKDATAQTVNFPSISDARASSPKVELKATSSAGLSVDYFVLKGPGIIQDGAFVPLEVPAGAAKPIEVTIGAYQVGVFKQAGGIKPTPTVFQTFHILP